MSEKHYDGLNEALDALKHFIVGLERDLSEGNPITIPGENNSDIPHTGDHSQRKIVLHGNGTDKVVYADRSAPINIYIDNSVHTNTTTIHETHTHVDNKIGIGDGALRFLSSLLG